MILVEVLGLAGDGYFIGCCQIGQPTNYLLHLSFSNIISRNMGFIGLTRVVAYLMSSGL